MRSIIAKSAVVMAMVVGAVFGVTDSRAANDDAATSGATAPNKKLAIAVIGGEFVATLLTLIVVPVVYSLAEGFWKTLTRGAGSPAPAEALAEAGD